MIPPLAIRPADPIAALCSRLLISVSRSHSLAPVDVSVQIFELRQIKLYFILYIPWMWASAITHQLRGYLKDTVKLLRSARIVVFGIS